MTEAERSEKHWEARRLLQRFLSGAISRNYPHPKKAMGPKVQRGPVHIQKEVCCVTVRPKMAVCETTERKTVVKITKLPRLNTCR